MFESIGRSRLLGQRLPAVVVRLVWIKPAQKRVGDHWFELQTTSQPVCLLTL